MLDFAQLGTDFSSEIAIRKAEDEQDYSEIDVLFNLLKKPFDEHQEFESYTQEAPDWARGLEVSCSS
ncbi:Selenoprotein O and cysteine-containing homologs [hydrothermal vent metagenome]|uniref:Selenoprotein O and cysteine-containing homologs n=1 Tax=hydrothermal vent metagenome TaxID=652676 RepID=A0A1W1DAC7_9ZZZZ